MNNAPNHHQGIVRAALASAFALSMASAISAPLSWNASSDFSTSQSTGAAGVWSYGSTGATLTGQFASFIESDAIAGYDYWNSPDFAQIGKAGPGGFSSGTVSVPGNTINVSPGASGEYAVVRFTALTSGSYTIDAAFWGDDFAGPTTTDVHVRSDGSDLFASDIDSYGRANGATWSGVMQLGAGQTIDFAVGYGSNRTYNFDNTGLDVSITEADTLSGADVPEPATLASLTLGFGVLLASRRKSRRSRA